RLYCVAFGRIAPPQVQSRGVVHSERHNQHAILGSLQPESTSVSTTLIVLAATSVVVAVAGSVGVSLGRVLTLAYQDQLTGLANRSRFFKKLSAAIEATRLRADNLAILVMDLDRFKYVNDTLGHDVGDHVLREVAGRLRRVLPPDCLARLG